MKKIIASDGTEYLVDDEKYDELKQHYWNSKIGGAGKYARRTERINGKSVTVFMHREVLGLNYKATDDGCYVDHINRNTTDNRLKNLRVASKSQNTQNSKTINRTSKYKGVFKWNNKWVANITKNNKQYIIKHYKSEKEAALAYDRYAKKMYGPNAAFNFKDHEQLKNIQYDPYWTPPKKNKDGYVGVRKSGKKWTASISKGGINYYLGTFETEIEAAVSYDEKSRELFGRGKNSLEEFKHIEVDPLYVNELKDRIKYLEDRIMELEDSNEVNKCY